MSRLNVFFCPAISILYLSSSNQDHDRHLSECRKDRSKYQTEPNVIENIYERKSKFQPHLIRGTFGHVIDFTKTLMPAYHELPWANLVLCSSENRSRIKTVFNQGTVKTFRHEPSMVRIIANKRLYLHSIQLDWNAELALTLVILLARPELLSFQSQTNL